jgi:predicted enzyme related to lactoylglutathione lyase
MAPRRRKRRPAAYGVCDDDAMSIRMQAVCVDARDPSALARFWSQVLGWRLTYEEPGEAVLEPPAGSPEDGIAADLVFLAVPDDKVVKNRLHIDLRPDDRDAEVARVEALGARKIDIGQGDDKTWVVLADPEGNEFCILRALTPDELAG